jgi:hypothetical protein
MASERENPMSLNVRDFGADPTGTIDSSGAFVAAIAAVNPTVGVRILVPMGKYKLSKRRFNRRFVLKTIHERLAIAATATPPMPYRLLKLAEPRW